MKNYKISQVKKKSHYLPLFSGLKKFQFISKSSDHPDYSTKRQIMSIYSFTQIYSLCLRPIMVHFQSSLCMNAKALLPETSWAMYPATTEILWSQKIMRPSTRCLVMYSSLSASSNESSVIVLFFRSRAIPTKIISLLVLFSVTDYIFS